MIKASKSYKPATKGEYTLRQASENTRWASGEEERGKRRDGKGLKKMSARGIFERACVSFSSLFLVGITLSDKTFSHK